MSSKSKGRHSASPDRQRGKYRGSSSPGSRSPILERKRRKHKHSSTSPERRQAHRKTQDEDRHRNGDHRERNRHKDDDQRQREHNRDRRDRETHGERRHRREEHDKRPVKQERNRGYGDEHEERARNDEKRRKNRRGRKGNPFNSTDDSQYEYGQPGQESADVKTEQKDKAKPDFGISGKLTEDTNTYKGVVIKYNEPPEARKPKRRWRFYPFKGDDTLPVLHLHRQSAYLLGRDRIIADIPVDHPSCSKQHAVFQYRLVEYEKGDGTIGHRVRPYIIDLGSTNGTYVNNQRIEAQRYVELMVKDVLKFGFSSREYVLLTDNTDTSEVDKEDGGEENE